MTATIRVSGGSASVRGWMPSLTLVMEQATCGVPGQVRRRVWLVAEDASVRRARLHLMACCVDWGLSELLDAAIWAVSELVTNAVQHVCWQRVAPPRMMALDVQRQGDTGVMVEVFDPDPTLPVLAARPEPGDVLSLPESGYGLHAVGALVAGHGGLFGTRQLRVGDRLAGKGVWFTLNAAHQNAGP